MDDELLFTLAEGQTLSQYFQSLDELKLTMLFPVNILGRGFTYYYEKQIQQLKIEAGKITAKVSGSEEYTTQIMQSDQEVYGSCNCLFEGKCKHIAALIIYTLHEVDQIY